MTPGYVYVAALSNGTIKVGRSQDAKKRLGSHRTNARTLGLTVIDSWTSPLHLEWRSNEDALKKIAVDLGGIPEGREAFSGIEFAAVVGGACELIFTEPQPEPEGPTAPQAAEPAVVTADSWERKLRRGCFTPRERAIAYAALEIGVTKAVAQAVADSPLMVRVVRDWLDVGKTVDDVEQLSPDTWDPGVDSMARTMKALISFECDVELILAREKAKALRGEAEYEMDMAMRVYGSRAGEAA